MAMTTVMSSPGMDMVRVHGPRHVSCDRVEIPIIGDNDVLVRVARCGLCGSDLGYIAIGGVAAPADAPFGIGHELSGTIEAAGASVRGISVGLRVVVNPMGDDNIIGNGGPDGGFAPLLRVHNATLGGSIHAIPDDVSFEHAALAEPLAVSLHAVRRANPSSGSNVAVFGAGPIGLGIVHFLKAAGVARIAVIDLSAGRLERARRLGADTLIDASQADVAAALGDAHGRAEVFGWPTVATDLFFEVSGAATVLPSIIAMAPFHARVVMVAVHHAPVPVDWKMALGKELTLTTAMGYPDEFPAALAAIAAPGFDADALISHRFPLDRFDEALNAARDRTDSAKVMVACDG
jgi:threonine dehydrogenase-like Zn-dependent dehydrogenase